MTGEATRADRKYREWVESLDLLRKHVTDLHMHRIVWKDVTEAIRTRASDSPALFLRSYTSQYVDSAAAGVRRIVTGGRRNTVSLDKVIAAMLAQPKVFTRRRYVDMRVANTVRDGSTGYDPQGRAAEGWEPWADPSDLEHLSGDRLRNDRAALLGAAAAAVRFADTAVAHIDAGGPADLTFDELDEAIEAVTQTFTAYTALLTGQGWHMEPALEAGWEKVFWQPLFDPPRQLRNPNDY